MFDRRPRWMERLEKIRRGKDRFFRDSPQSPLSGPDRESFEALQYYPVDAEYRFELQLHEHADKAMVILETTGGDERKMACWGEFRFDLAGRERTLQAYRSDPHEGRLFVPFRDETAATETYPRGRYLDLEPQTHLTPEGTWILDFNAGEKRYQNPASRTSSRWTGTR